MGYVNSNEFFSAIRAPLGLVHYASLQLLYAN